MATWLQENSMLTEKGVEILNKLNVGQGKITISRVVAGDGDVSDPRTMYEQHSVSGSTIELELKDLETDEEGTEMSFRVSNENFGDSFTIRQIGVYVTHPDYAGEVLYHISQCEEEGADIIPKYEGNLVTLNYSLYLVHGNRDSINLEVDPLDTVTQEEFDSFKTQITTKVTSLEDVFNSFKKGLREGKLITVDSSGNLIASGKNTVNGNPIIVEDAAELKALSLSIEGQYSQDATSVSAPKQPVFSRAVEIRLFGSKNLFNVKGKMLKTSGGSYGETTVTDTSFITKVKTSASVTYYGYIMPIDIGKKYTISFTPVPNTLIRYYQSDTLLNTIRPNDHGGSIISKSDGFTFVADKPFLLLTCSPDNKEDETLSYGFKDVQVEQSDVRTSYAPFKGVVIPLSTPITSTYVDLKSIGDYFDTVEWDGSKWWKVQRVEEIKIDGITNKVSADNMVNSTTYARSNIVLTSANNLITNAHPNAPVLCSHGNTVGLDSDFYAYYDSDSKCLKLHTKYTALGLSDGSMSASERATEINTWLKGRKDSITTNIKIWYVLNTPVVTELSMTEVLDMYNEYTKVLCIYERVSPNLKLGYALETTDSTILYILKSLARKSDIQVANTVATAELVE